jgi:hypothetical protein
MIARPIETAPRDGTPVLVRTRRALTHLVGPDGRVVEVRAAWGTAVFLGDGWMSADGHWLAGVEAWAPQPEQEAPRG